MTTYALNNNYIGDLTSLYLRVDPVPEHQDD
jgi:hypothetical protein